MRLARPDLLLDMPVALKLLRPELASPETAARLRAEAWASAHFAHPGIIRVFDIEETPSGEPCIVMELLEGETLYERLEREPLEEVELLRLLLPIADALCFVHESGLIHRDLKPENIFLANVGGRPRPRRDRARRDRRTNLGARSTPTASEPPPSARRERRGANDLGLEATRTLSRPRLPLTRVAHRRRFESPRRRVIASRSRAER